MTDKKIIDINLEHFYFVVVFKQSIENRPYAFYLKLVSGIYPI